MNRLPALLLLFCSLSLSAQYQFQRLNNMRELRLAAPLYEVSADYHSSIRPWDRWQMDSVSSARSWEDSLRFGWQKWLWRKAFNEHLVDVQGKNYHLTINPVVNLRVGADPSKEGEDLYYVNTRGFSIEGRLGEKVSFSTSFLENQARFPAYVGSFRGVIPGQGRARKFKDSGADFGMASGEVSFTPNDIFSFSLGQGRNFFGEGYRSMLLSDVAFNYPFFRIETSFWKIKYVNIWAQMYDLRPEAAISEYHAKKYFSSHYLSINLTKRLNLSFFEAIMVGDTTQMQGPDIAFFNPIIFYRPVEFAVGSEMGNALMGLNISYKLRDGLQAYGQFALDEFKLSAIRKQEGSWVNKYGWQLGIKDYKLFGVDGLFGRLEYNAARPYTYSHRVVLTNYAHYSQPLAHPWGANFHELLGQAVWQHGRWEAEARAHWGLIGLNTPGTNWGADLYQSYYSRERDLGNEIGQGEKGDYRYLYLRGAYLINPATGLKLEAGWRYRSLSTQEDLDTKPLMRGESHYVFVGLRTEFFNRYYDF